MSRFDPITARLVLALARDGSIAKAAEREHIAPSAISRRIAVLEARSGLVLFDRSAQGVRLTAAGEAYAEGARSIFRAIADLETSLAGFASGKAGQLRIAATSSALAGHLPELLALYVQDFPEVRLDIREMAARAALAALEDAQVDIAILADNYNFSNFEVMPFVDDRVWVIASPDHPLAEEIMSHESISFERVASHEVVGIHHGGALDRLLSEAARKAGRTLGERVRVESFPSLVRMVEAGFGIGFLRHSSLHLLASTDLVCTPLSESWAKRQLLIAYRKSVRISQAVQAFLELCGEVRSPRPSPDERH